MKTRAAAVKGAFDLFGNIVERKVFFKKCNEKFAVQNEFAHLIELNRNLTICH